MLLSSAGNLTSSWNDSLGYNNTLRRISTFSPYGKPLSIGTERYSRNRRRDRVRECIWSSLFHPPRLECDSSKSRVTHDHRFITPSRGTPYSPTCHHDLRSDLYFLISIPHLQFPELPQQLSLVFFIMRDPLQFEDIPLKFV